MSEIKFWKSTDEYGFLSNFYVFPIKINNKEYKTVEHWFQSQKFVGTQYEEYIRKQPTAHQAAKEGKRKDFPLRKDWEKVKEDIMLQGLREKFKHSKMKSRLMYTGYADLIEDSPYDYYWGIGKNGNGKNRLGHLLMQIRDELRKPTDDNSSPMKRIRNNMQKIMKENKLSVEDCYTAMDDYYKKFKKDLKDDTQW